MYIHSIDFSKMWILFSKNIPFVRLFICFVEKLFFFYQKFVWFCIELFRIIFVLFIFCSCFGYLFYVASFETKKLFVRLRCVDRKVISDLFKQLCGIPWLGKRCAMKSTTKKRAVFLNWIANKKNAFYIVLIVLAEMIFEQIDQFVFLNK